MDDGDEKMTTIPVKVVTRKLLKSFCALRGFSYNEGIKLLLQLNSKKKGV